MAPFLARRLRADGRKLLLIVIDGMAFAQWSVIHRELKLRVIEGGGCFAMCPTLTSVSRQAIFAGTLPANFRGSLWTTAKERDHWFRFWDAEGVTRSDVAWMRVRGSDASEVPPLPQRSVVGVIVGAVDELLHASDVNGDAQLVAGIRTWCRFSFLRTLLEQAHAAGFCIWVTADHGNIEALPSGRVMEGLRVEKAGTRVRIYDSASLRDAARPDGIPWDPPGIPADKAFLFCAETYRVSLRGPPGDARRAERR